MGRKKNVFSVTKLYLPAAAKKVDVTMGLNRFSWLSLAKKDFDSYKTFAEHHGGRSHAYSFQLEGAKDWFEKIWKTTYAVQKVFAKYEGFKPELEDRCKKKLSAAYNNGISALRSKGDWEFDIFGDYDASSDFY